MKYKIKKATAFPGMAFFKIKIKMRYDSYEKIYNTV